MIRIEEILQYESESHLVDFKRMEYNLRDKNKKHEFLKDISSMANNPVDEDKYIIIGVVEKNGIATDFYNLQEITDQAQYQQYLDSNIEPSIRFEYKQFSYNGFALSFFRIYDNTDRPYLFRKDLIVTENDQQIKYNKGDGFIRVGTSTRRLQRSDFDNIYEGKSKKIDRRSDLEISVCIERAENEFNIRDEKYLDLRVENKSFKSIGFDIEMKILFDQQITVVSRNSLKSTMIIPKRGSSFGIETIYNPTLPNLDVFIEENENYLYIERCKRKFEEYAVKLPQNSFINEIFFKELILRTRKTFTLRAEVTIRSDEFINGPLVINLEEIIEV